MARRRRILEDDDDPDSHNGSEAEDLPMNECSGMARREHCMEYLPKESRDPKKNKRSDWTKAPAFVSGAKKIDFEEETEPNIEEEDETSTQRKKRILRMRAKVRAQRNLLKTTLTLLGLGALHLEYLHCRIGSDRKTGIGIGFSEAGATSSTITASSFASSKGGIRSRTSVAHTPSSDPPSAFTSQTRPASFVRDSTPTVCPAAPLSYDEQAHFAKLSSSFGAGQGLGATGGGIVTPIESKMRPEKSVIAFRGFKEKRERSKIQARRRGEVVSVEEKSKKEGEVKDSKQAEAWRKPREVTTKIQHKTYEEILAEAGIETSTSARIGQIIDATGAVVTSRSQFAGRRLNQLMDSYNGLYTNPEVPHNVRLIAESCKTDIDGLAREGKLLEERKKLVVQEDLRLRKRIEDETECKHPRFPFPNDLSQNLIDIGLMKWLLVLLRLRALRFNVEDETLLETPVDIYGTKTVVSSPVQSAEGGCGLDSEAGRQESLATKPRIPLAPPCRIEPRNARGKAKSLLRHWVVGDDLPEDSQAWKDVFDANDWDSMLPKYIVPQSSGQHSLPTCVSTHVTSPWNPFTTSFNGPPSFDLRSSLSYSKQNFSLNGSTSYVSGLSSQKSASRRWYSFWKGFFPDNIQSVSGISRGFTRGLRLMNQAIELGPDAPSQLSKPDYRAEQAQHALANSPYSRSSSNLILERVL
ncbi:hypothetical protein C8J55DRAFT_489694 [Lentinula edodes]|uniref:Tuftelin interacting protein N-terminal domain-containing protein n=1 Tax=Lentinula lateritia TaxID=40482 RepID=A0A9W9DMR5_9AGAR|nr:hypothetical protein C8J55DRAFT_489694 [Lentinula edodes]